MPSGPSMPKRPSSLTLISSPSIPIPGMVAQIDSDRQSMDTRYGMIIKYVPLQIDSTTGEHHIGGRYLFETWEDAQDYMRYTGELEFEPGVKFWSRPVFSNVIKGPWRVVGAENFKDVKEHYGHRVERFELEIAASEQVLKGIWTKIRDAAETNGLAAVWLLHQPEEKQLAVLTFGTKVVRGTEEENAQASQKALEDSQSPSIHLDDLKPRNVFDRTSLNISVWLPLSGREGGLPSAHPLFPLYPKPKPILSQYLTR